VSPAPPTIKDVATAAGVSVSTVSLAFSAPDRVAPATRERILAMAERLGYRPNLSASILRSRSPGPNSVTRKISLAFIHAQNARSAPLYEADVRDRASELGYGLEPVALTTLASKVQLRRELYSRGVAGVVLGPILDPREVEGLDLSPFSVVRCGRYRVPVTAHLVRPAVVQTVTTAWQELVRRNYRRIGAAFHRHIPEVPDDFTREMVVQACQTRYHRKADRIPILWTTSGRQLDAVEPWFNKYQPDVILHFASPASDWACQSGISIPDQLGLIGLIAPWHPDECAVVENSREIARAAVDLCDQLVRHRQTAPPDVVREIVIPSLWREGSSLRPAS
jgi:LacI family transcriptional regulator